MFRRRPRFWNAHMSKPNGVRKTEAYVGKLDLESGVSGLSGDAQCAGMVMRTSLILPRRTSVAALSFSQPSIVVLLPDNDQKWYRLKPPTARRTGTQNV